MELIWDTGTAYDLFASLYVIHNPDEFGVRPAWAAGVRSRIPTPSRELLSLLLDYTGTASTWVYALPDGKDAENAIREIERMEPERVLPAVFIECEPVDAMGEVLLEVAGRESWSDQDVERIVTFLKKHKGESKVDRKKLASWLDWWSRPRAAGELYAAGLREYYEAFFREEERRIRPALQEGLDRAKELARKLEPEELFDELTEGVRSAYFESKQRLLLVPSFWTSPRVFVGEIDDTTGLLIFGTRPENASLIPGDAIPDRLSAGLNALSDNTRLNILKLLSERPMSQVEIARELRLRAPTISHHLKNLRIASLVNKSYGGNEKTDIKYSVRSERIDELCDSLRSFLSLE